jgi:hypothetical protein
MAAKGEEQFKQAELYRTDALHQAFGVAFAIASAQQMQVDARSCQYGDLRVKL